MKPIRLTMNAFGPYKGKEIVDFEELGEHRLFSISGNTGAGKKQQSLMRFVMRSMEKQAVKSGMMLSCCAVTLLRIMCIRAWSLYLLLETGYIGL
ncbi:hypothetical protein GCM10020331_063500 [Ectobacillus funiculus]